MSTQPECANTPGFEVTVVHTVGPGTSAQGCAAFHNPGECGGPSSYFPILVLQGKKTLILVLQGVVTA